MASNRRRMSRSRAMTGGSGLGAFALAERAVGQPPFDAPEALLVGDIGLHQHHAVEKGRARQAAWERAGNAIVARTIAITIDARRNASIIGAASAC